jgi:hypothetical protein
MNARTVTKLTLAALLAGAVPAAAHAHDWDHDARPIAVQPAPWQPAPPPPAIAPLGEDRGFGHREWRGGGWRARELARIDAELRALDAERADFHARFAFRPGALRRFDRGYFVRRAEIEHRRGELVRVAWR